MSVPQGELTEPVVMRYHSFGSTLALFLLQLRSLSKLQKFYYTQSRRVYVCRCVLGLYLAVETHGDFGRLD